MFAVAAAVVLEHHAVRAAPVECPAIAVAALDGGDLVLGQVEQVGVLCRRPPLDQGGWSSESVSHGCIGHDTEADWHQSAPGTPERRLLALEVILD